MEPCGGAPADRAYQGSDRVCVLAKTVKDAEARRSLRFAGPCPRLAATMGDEGYGQVGTGSFRFAQHGVKSIIEALRGLNMVLKCGKRQHEAHEVFRVRSHHSSALHFKVSENEGRRVMDEEIVFDESVLVVQLH